MARGLAGSPIGWKNDTKRERKRESILAIPWPATIQHLMLVGTELVEDAVKNEIIQTITSKWEEEQFKKESTKSFIFKWLTLLNQFFSGWNLISFTLYVYVYMYMLIERLVVWWWWCLWWLCTCSCSMMIIRFDCSMLAKPTGLAVYSINVECWIARKNEFVKTKI